MHFNELKDKNVALWGLGREGKAFINLWKKRCPQKTLAVLDEKPSPESESLARENNFRYITEENVVPSLMTFDVIVKSPGISRYRSEIENAKKTGVKFTSLVDLWFSENENTSKVVITGTKGKSTTSALTAHLLKSLGQNVVLAGNVGIPLFTSEETSADTIYVIELSSYQATEINCSIPLAVLLNLYPEHSDWHGSVEQYYLDKLNIFRQQNSNSCAIINGSDLNTTLYREMFKHPILFNDKSGIHYQNYSFYANSIPLFPRSVSPLLGEHNASNICAALTIIASLGFDPSTAVTGLQTFTGLPHRLQYVGTYNGLTYIDDSISTIPQAALAALKAIKGSPITILLGGQERAQNWDEFAESLLDNTPYAVITMPDNGKEIAHALEKHAPKSLKVFSAADLESAVALAKNITPKDGTVLLSPAAPSYGHFKNFEERGEKFSEYAKL